MKLDILAIGAHPDDVEVAAGGTLLHHIALGRKIGLLDLTKSERSTRGTVLQRRQEARTCRPDLVVDITPHIDRKFAAIRAYQSQFYQPDCLDPETPLSCPSFFEALRGQNAMLGRQIGVDYAEGFTVVRTVGAKDLFDLV